MADFFIKFFEKILLLFSVLQNVKQKQKIQELETTLEIKDEVKNLQEPIDSLSRDELSQRLRPKK